MTAKLNQIIAVEKGIKSRVYGEITDINKTVQKPDLFSGFAKEYRKKDDDGEDLPPERKRVQFTAAELLRRVERLATELMDVTARKDWTNCRATADVTVDGRIIVAGVPVTFLLFLEKQLTDLRTLVGNLPVLDEGENWSRDPNSGLYKTEPTQTHRTKKISKPIVLYPATPEHPAQTQLVSEDVIAGFWHLVKHSGAMPKPDKERLAERVEKLLQAVKRAREEANGVEEVPTPPVGGPVFAYLLEE
jgi:hypothetical protein